ncbi:MAG: hypothetical protein IRZ32_17540 [Solirubrobacteraceae bacterium]|nr:hypothetical protein [Solirubrobacteraceae bacterium]
MSEFEHPSRTSPDHEVTVDDIRQLTGAATPHFAQQIRNRVAKLIAPLPADHPARIEGEREIDRLTRLGFTGETRGTPAQPGQRPLRSNSGAAPALEAAEAR